VRKLLQILIVGAAIIYILSEMDINVTALIAGLSIGALALALAAQDTVKNLIGSIMIFIDKPFQVGDWVLLDGQEGTIIEVGFRSTRIQLLDTSIVSMPNGNVANLTIINLGVRTFRLLNVLIGVTYDTSPEKIEAFTEALKKLILEHPEIHKENSLVHFREMGDFALKIIFRCFIPVNNIGDELRIKEQIYLEIMRIAQRLNIEFAFPSQTIYMAKDGEGAEEGRSISDFGLRTED
jgi:MscS family membrane protein